MYEHVRITQLLVDRVTLWSVFIVDQRVGRCPNLSLCIGNQTETLGRLKGYIVVAGSERDEEGYFGQYKRWNPPLSKLYLPDVIFLNKGIQHETY